MAEYHAREAVATWFLTASTKVHASPADTPTSIKDALLSALAGGRKVKVIPLGKPEGTVTGIHYEDQKAEVWIDKDEWVPIDQIEWFSAVDPQS